LNNRVDAELIARGGEVLAASGIDQALAALKVVDEEVDMHPEKRQKAAYNAFEAKRLQLKQEFPTLKFTQLKEKLQREWKKSPDNPVADTK
jgi:Coiled-coil domain-containing protein 124 /Oxs1